MQRTKKLALEVIKLYSSSKVKTDEFRIVGKQLLRSSTSVAANYRATCRARSKAEFYSKLSIVIEETDETMFWLELLNESDMLPPSIVEPLKNESMELLSIFSKARKNTIR